MVNIRFLTKEGDTMKTMQLAKAKTELAEQLEKGNLVYDEDERKIVERATLGKIKGDSNIAVFPKISGG